MNEVIEDVPGTIRLNATGDLEQLREVKIRKDENLVAIEQRWILVPTVS